jgi:hypothetical protein
LQKYHTFGGFPCSASTVMDNAPLNSLHLGDVQLVAGIGADIT